MKKLAALLIIATLALTGCSNPKEEDVKEVNNNESNEKKEGNEMQNPIATITFKDLGVMKFELQINKAPQSVYNFVELAEAGFYEDLTMHRIVKDFVVQGGDPDGTGMGGPGHSIKGEFYNNNVQNDTGHTLGAIAFARSQARDSAGSQFYIVLSEYDSANRKRMDNDYAAFGTMLEGQELLEIINNEYASGQGEPVKPLIIESVTIDTLGQIIPAPDKLK